MHFFSRSTEHDGRCCHERSSAQGCLLMTNWTFIRVVTVISDYIKTSILTSKSRVIYWRKPREAFLQNEWCLLKALTSDLMTRLWWKVRWLYSMEPGNKNVSVPSIVLALLSANAVNSLPLVTVPLIYEETLFSIFLGENCLTCLLKTINCKLAGGYTVHLINVFTLI